MDGSGLWPNIKTLFKPLAPPDKANQSLPVSAALRAPRRAAGGDLLPFGRQGASCQLAAVKSHRGIYGALCFQITLSQRYKKAERGHRCVRSSSAPEGLEMLVSMDTIQL